MVECGQPLSFNCGSLLGLLARNGAQECDRTGETSPSFLGKNVTGQVN